MKTAFNFIDQYTIPHNICDFFIKYHQNNKEYKKPGLVQDGVINKNIKNSLDVYFFNENIDPIIQNFFSLLSKSVSSYAAKYSIKHAVQTHTLHSIQYYKKKEGYFKLHYERADLQSTDRQLVYMLYCNTLKNGGTEFPFQNRVLKAAKGTLFIWPSDFTHPHKGVISDEEEKYIVTGWFNII